MSRSEAGAAAIYPSRWKLAVYLVLCSFFVMAGALALAVDPATRTEWWPYALVAMFGLAAVVLGRTLLVREPAVEFDAEGIAGRGVPKLRWDEIESLSRSRMRHRMSTWHYLSIRPRDPELVVKRTQGLRRALARADAALDLAPINIAISHLDRSPDEIIRMVERISGRTVRPL